MKNKHKKGFTLIEVIIYIALFSLLLGTAFVTAYGLITGFSSLGAKNITVEEGNFVLRKINWTLTGAESITAPSASIPLSGMLVVQKYDGNIITIRLEDNKIEIKESTDGNTFTPITTENVSVENLQFQYLTPPGITGTFSVDDTDFSITKYKRQ